MRTAVFSTRRYDREFLDAVNAGRHELVYLEPGLSPETASLAAGFPAVCCFVNDDLGRASLERLHAGGTRFVALRSAGFNHVDLAAADELGITVMRVPAYSPHAVAEHTFGLVLALNRRIHRASHRVRDGNFSLDGLLGFDLHGKTIGIVGTGVIGRCVVDIARGFGMHVLAHDPFPHDAVVAAGGEYVDMPALLSRSDVVTLHCPLTRETHHLIDIDAVAQMRPHAMLINTSRGALVDTVAIIRALKTGALGAVGLDVYEEEAHLFFEDLSDKVIPDDVFARLLTFPNVLITAHQAFFTREAMSAIAATTLDNLDAMQRGETTGREVDSKLVGA